LAQICGSNVRSLNPDQLVFRSPEAMIKYLGALARRRPAGGNDYFKIVGPIDRIPADALLGTRFRGNLYYVPNERNDENRYEYAETLALLAEIIGFQTTNAELNASKPTVTVPTE
jgi:hypothetical protein